MELIMAYRPVGNSSRGPGQIAYAASRPRPTGKPPQRGESRFTSLPAEGFGIATKKQLVGRPPLPSGNSTLGPGQIAYQQANPLPTGKPLQGAKPTGTYTGPSAHGYSRHVELRIAPWHRPQRFDECDQQQRLPSIAVRTRRCADDFQCEPHTDSSHRQCVVSQRRRRCD